MIARSRPTVYKLIASGEIRAKKHGGRTLIVVESLRAWASGLPDVPPTPAS
ncbi:helix-turn-helix domain-containing protein [Sphingomonas hankookensis]|uniref:helix-turn-helix domain-containing protein n=1 Tax=Sphingomonas hankookensis TaxID=563996 RepID=UPI003D301971